MKKPNTKCKTISQRFNRTLFFLFFGLSLLLSPRLFSQAYHLAGTVQETFTKTPIAFAHIRVNEGEQHSFSDADGNFEIHSSKPIKTITFHQYLHRDVKIDNLKLDNDHLIINLNRYDIFRFSDSTDLFASKIISQVISYKNYNKIENIASYQYTSYNKFTFATAKKEQANKLIRDLSKALPFKFKELMDEQHFFILETVTEKKYRDKLHQKERIEGAKSSGVDVPSVFIEGSQLQNFSLYEDYVTMGGKVYISPLAKKTQKRYVFTLIDFAYTSTDTILIIKFNPGPRKSFDALKGLLYINTKNYAVQYFVAGPAEEGIYIETSIVQSYKLHNENTWFPDRLKTMVSTFKGGLRDVRFVATGNTYISDVTLNNGYKKRNFDEVILEYPKEAGQQDSLFWDKSRKTPLSKGDSNTYTYFKNYDQKKHIEKFLQLGEKFYYGYIPAGRFNIDVNRLLTFNAVEGTRVGFGLHSNNKFSDKYSFGAFAGYGIKDKRLKYGADFSARLMDYKNIVYKTFFSYDLKEAGGTSFFFDRPQYSTELLRKYRLRIMDLVAEYENALSAHPLKNLDVGLALNISHHTTTYTYAFKNNNTSQFDFTELRAGLRYSFGEQFLRILDNQKALPTKYPVFYFQYTKGLNAILGNYNYNKFDFKLEQRLKILDFGISTFQFTGGVVAGETPYSILYNGKGSLKKPSVVIHNSFETMAYNEFLSDRFLALFYAHNFGRIYFPSKFIKPSILMLHNMGVGSLKNPQDQKGIPFKTMEKGYFESGLFADNIFVVNLGGMKTGLGAGGFLRYGPYALPKAGQNLVFKFSLNFYL